VFLTVEEEVEWMSFCCWTC